MEVNTVLGQAVVNIFLAGHGLKHIKTEWEGRKIISQTSRIVSNVYGLEIRLKPDASDRGGRVLWHGTTETKLDERPELPPEATIFLNALRPPQAATRRRPRSGA